MQCIYTCTYVWYIYVCVCEQYVLSMHCRWPGGFSLAEDRLLPFSAGHEGEGFWVRRRSLGWRWEGCLMSPEMPPEIHFFLWVCVGFKWVAIGIMRPCLQAVWPGTPIIAPLPQVLEFGTVVAQRCLNFSFLKHSIIGSFPWVSTLQLYYKLGWFVVPLS